MREPHSFIIKFVTINAFTSSAVLISDVTSLHHEVFDDAMEDVAFVAETVLLTSTDASKVFSSLWHLLIEELKDHSSFVMAFFSFFTNLDVEVGLRVVNVELR